MDFGIKELGITLMVGAFTLLGFEAIMHYFFNNGLIGFFEGKLGLEADKQTKEAGAPAAESTGRDGKHKREKDQTMRAAVFIVLAFAIGIIAEDLSYKNDDSESKIPFNTIPAKILPDFLVNEIGLPTEDDNRISSLLKALKRPDPKPLLLDLARSDAFLIGHDPERGAKVQRWVLAEKRCQPAAKGSGDCPSIKDIQNSIKTLYYYAKNSVYANPNHYDEMKRIQARLEFTRSLSMIAFIYFVVAAVLGVFLLLWHRSKRKGSDKHQTRLTELRTRVPATVAILFCVYFVSVWAFAQEADAFNKRAFGYFSTMLISEERQRVQTLQDRLAETNQARANAPTSEAPITKP